MDNEVNLFIIFMLLQNIIYVFYIPSLVYLFTKNLVEDKLFDCVHTFINWNARISLYTNYERVGRRRI